jgi:hypothetical protein
MAFRIGNVFVLENFRTAVLIVDRSFHRLPLIISAAPHSTIAE